MTNNLNTILSVISDKESIRHLYLRVRKRCKALHLLCNSASYWLLNHLTHWSQWYKVLDRCLCFKEMISKRTFDTKPTRGRFFMMITTGYLVPFVSELQIHFRHKSMKKGKPRLSRKPFNTRTLRFKWWCNCDKWLKLICDMPNSRLHCNIEAIEFPLSSPPGSCS